MAAMPSKRVVGLFNQMRTAIYRIERARNRLPMYTEDDAIGLGYDIQNWYAQICEAAANYGVKLPAGDLSAVLSNKAVYNMSKVLVNKVLTSCYNNLVNH